MTARSLNTWPSGSLLYPQSIAVIGASQDPDGHTGRVVANLLRTRFAGKIYPVNPRHSEISGLSCYASVLDIDPPPDCAYVLVPADRALGAVRECASAGVHTIVVCSSGFAEIGQPGRQMQVRLAETAREHGARLLGPNCIGVANPSDGFIAAPTFNITDDFVPGGIALLTQCGGIGINVFNRAQGRGIGIRAMVSLGNEADLNAADILESFVDDTATSVIALVLEQVRDTRHFVQAVKRARELGKHVVALKLGKSDAGVRNVQSHTGAMAGSYAIFEDIMRQIGVTVAHRIDDLVNVSYLLSMNVIPNSNRILVVSPSGGECTYLADVANKSGLELPELNSDTRDQLQKMMRFGSPANPMDLTGEVIGNSKLATQISTILNTDTSYDSVLFGIPTWGEHDAHRLLPRLVDANKRNSRPTIYSAWSASQFTASTEDHLKRSGAHWFPTADDAVSALSLAVTAGEHAATYRDIHESTLKGPEIPLYPFTSHPPNEKQVKSFLAEQGLPVSDELVTTTLTEARQYASTQGWPIVMKELCEGVIHKSKLGLVETDISNYNDLDDTWDKFKQLSDEYGLTSVGTLLSRQYTGIELIVGAIREPSFGPVIMLGSGGIFTEQTDDKRFALCPITREYAHDMLHSLKLDRILTLNGVTRYDTTALAVIVAQVSQLMTRASWIKEIDLNPVLVHDLPNGGATIIDAALITD